ncbi:MAG: hypothetical protein C9356_18005 [Oleiphilus sp.]|nr:MAG: hypothetical protein C9356_18005 [Oleiphilus sp.]
MSVFSKSKSALNALLALCLIIAPLHLNLAQAAMVSTESRIADIQQISDRKQLTELLATEQAQDALVHLGVAPDVVAERVQVMTPAELAHLNAEIEQMPAGAGILGVVVLVFVVLIVLDLLGTTNVFPAIKSLEQD